MGHVFTSIPGETPRSSALRMYFNLVLDAVYTMGQSATIDEYSLNTFFQRARSSRKLAVSPNASKEFISPTRKGPKELWFGRCKRPRFLVKNFNHQLVEFIEDQGTALGAIFKTGMDNPITEHPKHRIFVSIAVHEFPQLDQQINELHFVRNWSVENVLNLLYKLILH